MASGTGIGMESFGGTAARRAPAVGQTLEERLSLAIERGVDHLLSLQKQKGYWLGELEADTTLESDYIFYLHILGKAEPQRIAKLANYIRARQMPDGGWNIYFGGPSELNATVKAYVALKLAGDSVDAPHMSKARERAKELGGLESTNSYVRLYLALVGALDWKMTTAVPPELMLLPNWFAFNVYEMSSWTRGIVIPLTILYAIKPRWKLGIELKVDELFQTPGRSATAFDWDREFFTWKNFFLLADRTYKVYDRMIPTKLKPLRGRAVRRAQKWMLEHLKNSEGLGAIYPAMMNAVFALVAMGHGPDDPLTAREIAELGKFEMEGQDAIRVQPCVSPVWDTAIVLVALAEAGLPADHPAMVRAAEWLLDMQIFKPGDWQVKVRGVEPAGWAFEFSNDWNPDVDDTAFVLMALQRVNIPDRERMNTAVRKGIAWLLAMQNRDGGWGAFDRNNEKWYLTKVPFADHNAMIDPATADVTARVMECLARFGWSNEHPAMRRAEAFLRRDQKADGSWFGRWGVNYVYGTSGVLRALEAAGLAARDFVKRGVEWLKRVQNVDGGYGESIASYDDESLKAKGVSTASQTAWGLIGLLAAGEQESESTSRAVDYLLRNQNGDGSWDEAEFTGTGFPRVFYLKYHLYRDAFPVYALGRHRNLLDEKREYRGEASNPAEFSNRGN